MRKNLSLVMALTALVSLFFGCQSTNAPSAQNEEQSALTSETAAQGEQPAVSNQPMTSADEEVNMVFWIKKTFSEENDKMLEARVLDFADKNGIHITVEHIPSSNVTEIFNTSIEAKTLPDVSFMVTEMSNMFYDQGLLLPLDDVKAALETKNGPFSANYITNGTKSDGKIYTLPLYGSPRVVYYREDLLKAAGYNEPPKTWEEFREVAKAVTDPDSGIYGFGQPIGPVADFENNFRGMLWSCGGAIWDENGNVAMQSPETEAALQLWLDMFYADGSIPPDAISWDDAGNNNAYLAGTAAMVINNNTILRALQAPGYEDLLAATKITAPPSGSNGETYVFGGGNLTSVFSSTKYPEIAKDLVEYIYEEEWYIEWLSGVCGEMTPVFPGMADKEPFVSTDDIPMLLNLMNSSLFPGYPGPNSPVSTDLISSRVIGYAVQEMAMNQTSAKDGLAALQKKTEEFVASR